jgi:hypothetical protein
MNLKSDPGELLPFKLNERTLVFYYTIRFIRLELGSPKRLPLR